MKKRLAVTALFLHSVLPLLGEEEKSAEDPSWKKLQESAAAFVDAYNKKDPDAIVALFTPDAEMVLDDGSRVSGHEEIGSLFNEGFKARPEATVALEATSVRFLTDNLAVEDGVLHVTLEPDDEESIPVRYTVLHAKQEDGTWKMARSRDHRVQAPAAHEAMRAVDGLVGNWIARTDTGSLRMTFSYDESGAFLIGKMTYRAAGEAPADFTMRIGWDPQLEKIVSWTFDSQGGYGKAVWTPAEDRWIVKVSGYTSEGEPTSATTIIRAISESSFSWAVTDKIIGDEVLPERELVLVREAPKPQAAK